MRATGIALLSLGLAVSALPAAAEGGPAPAPNGIRLPADYKDWRLISPSYRTDKNHVRAILGNDTAIQAARAGKTLPWPDGTVLAKLVWKEAPHERFPAALEPGEFVHVEIMVRDNKRYAATGGWGYARWLGKDLKPYGKDAGFAQECHACHTLVQDTDHEFTRPVSLP